MLLAGKNAIVSKSSFKKAPKGSIPPIRIHKLSKSSKVKPETQHCFADEKKRRNSTDWKDLKAENKVESLKTVSKSSSTSSIGGSKTDTASPKRRSDSSSYSEESECDSSTSTSLCDDDITSSLEASPMKKRNKDLQSLDVSKGNMKTIEEISPVAIELKDCIEIAVISPDCEAKLFTPVSDFYLDFSSSYDITSTSQLSPMPDITTIPISPIQTPCNFFEFPDFNRFILDTKDRFQGEKISREGESFIVNEEGVTNEFFERIFEENITAIPVSSEKNPSPSVLKYQFKNSLVGMKQKSLSMDEPIKKKDVISRSFSYDTIANVEFRTEEFQEIQSKALKDRSKLTEVYYEISSNQTEIEKMKSSENSSDVENEIADVTKEEKEFMISDVLNLAESYMHERKQSSDTSFNCNTYTDESSVERIGKSINEESHATLSCNSFKSKTATAAESEGSSSEALILSIEKSKTTDRRVEEKIESPKFNDIQLMVTKLKEEMESQLKACGPVVEEIVFKTNSEIKTEEKPSAKPVNNKQTTMESELKQTTETPKFEAKVGSVGKESSQSFMQEDISTDDLEKSASSLEQKINTIDSYVILEKLETQKEVSTESEQKDVDGKKAEALMYKNTITDVHKGSRNLPEIKKNSQEILENLNLELERYEKSRRSIEPKGRSTYETSAVMELALMIKERELEKLSEEKQLMKTQKDFKIDFNKSPVRTARSQISPQMNSPESKNLNYFIDHEPRNATRRCDVNTLETEQRLRRPFKSSPSNSLSSPPSNISNTLSSIQNTIKILDSALSDEINTKSSHDKAMERVEKICDKDWNWRAYKEKNRYESPKFKIVDNNLSKRQDFEKELSPIRTPSPSKFSVKTPDLDSNYAAKLRYLSTEEYIAGRKSPLSASRENLTVKLQIDRSSTSPVLGSRSVLSPSYSSSLLRFPSSETRSSKSAENSPSRYSGERFENNYKHNSVDCWKADSMRNLSYKKHDSIKVDVMKR